MIKNESQALRTHIWERRFDTALRQISTPGVKLPPGVHPGYRKAMAGSLREVRDDLRRELTEYEERKKKRERRK